MTTHGPEVARLQVGVDQRVSRDEAVVHIFQTPNNAFYVQPGLIDSNFDFLILEAQR